MEWADDVKNRPRRANAGSRLQELLQNGLDEEDELDLRRLGSDSSDTSFTLGSDEEALDEVESDFDAEEVAGTLEGEAVETDATVRRAERQERQRERKKILQRSQKFSAAAAHDRAALRKRQNKRKKREREKAAQSGHRSKRKRARREGKGGEDDDGTCSAASSAASGSSPSSSASSSSDDDRHGSEDGNDSSDDGATVDLRQRVRRRPPPTIPCAQRLAEAHARASAARVAALDGGGEDGSLSTAPATLPTHRGLNPVKTRPRTRRNGGPRRAGDARLEDGGSSTTLASSASATPAVVCPRVVLYDGVSQRIAYSSGVSVLERFHVPTVLSFSEQLPPVFQGSSG